MPTHELQYFVQEVIFFLKHWIIYLVLGFVGLLMLLTILAEMQTLFFNDDKNWTPEDDEDDEDDERWIQRWLGNYDDEEPGT